MIRRNFKLVQSTLSEVILVNRFCSLVFVALFVFSVSINAGASSSDIGTFEQENCVEVGKPIKDPATDVYSVPLTNNCTYKVKVVVTNGGVNYGKILETTASGQIVLGKTGAKDDYAVTWKKMS